MPMVMTFNDVADASKTKAAVRALQTWQYLIGKAHNRQLVRYKELSTLMGYSDTRPLTPILSHIMYYCRDHKLPPLTALVVNREGVPGGGFTEAPLDKIGSVREDVFGFDWYGIYPPDTSMFRNAWDNNS